MPNPITNFKDSFGTDLGNKLITKEYLMSVYPNIAQELGKTPELWIWGNSALGRTGTGAISLHISTPITTFAGGTNWKQISAGLTFTMAIKTDGTLWTWGAGFSGQLADNTGLNRSTPVTTFAGGTNWKQCSNHNSSSAAAIKTDGTLWTWGVNTYGQLGINNTIIRSTPVTTFAGGTNWKQVCCGALNMAAIKTDGTLWTWGRNFYGAIGDNTTTNRSTPVTTFAGGTNWKQVSCGYTWMAAIKTDGTLWVWGVGTSGQLGNANLFLRSTPVTTFAGGTNWKQVCCGYSSVQAIKTDGTLWTWGKGSYGQLGNNSTTIRSTPVTTFAGGTNWKSVDSSGSASSMSATVVGAIKTDGTLWMWGGNTGGSFRLMLGINAPDNKNTPVTTFAGGTNWKQISIGGIHSGAIQSADFI